MTERVVWKRPIYMYIYIYIHIYISPLKINVKIFWSLVKTYFVNCCVNLNKNVKMYGSESNHIFTFRVAAVMERMKHLAKSVKLLSFTLKIGKQKSRSVINCIFSTGAVFPPPVPNYNWNLSNTLRRKCFAHNINFVIHNWTSSATWKLNE